jgi:trehalose-phosphatase
MNQSLFQELSKIEDRIRTAARISLFLDFDGTLVPLQQDPSAARLDAPARESLSRIAGNEHIATTIISGRAVADLLLRIGIEGLVYAGNHGLEICGRQLRFIEPAAAARREDLRQLSGQIAAEFGNIAGVLVEYKGLTTSVHYRGAAVRELARIESTVRALASPAAESFVVRSGKMAFEIVPRTSWHKGAAALWINQSLDHGNILSIYLGDDTTDEDAFRALPDQITVKVGNSAITSARYHLANPSAVHEFLTWLAKHVPARTPRY